MPFADGKLSEDEVARIDANLQRLWSMAGGRQPCPKCGFGPYFIIPQLNGNRSDTLNPSDPHWRFPTVMVTCQRCGYLDQYLASNLGIQWLLPPLQPPPLVQLNPFLRHDTGEGHDG